MYLLGADFEAIDAGCWLRGVADNNYSFQH
jgi:hypothetical protein